MKKFTDLSGIRTEVLFIQARQMYHISLLSSLLGIFILAVMLFAFKSIDNEKLYFAISAIAFLFFIALFANWHLTRNIFPELKKRCRELSNKFTDDNYIVKYKKQRKWGILGTLSFFLSLCLYVISRNSGLIKPNNHSLQSELIQIILISMLFSPSLIFFLLRIRCPACKRFIPKQYENKQGTCPHCGVKLKEN
jgi:Kef-type K+ transport system membrane component KefB